MRSKRTMHWSPWSPTRPRWKFPLLSPVTVKKVLVNKDQNVSEGDELLVMEVASGGGKAEGSSTIRPAQG